MMKGRTTRMKIVANADMTAFCLTFNSVPSSHLDVVVETH